MEVEIDSTFTYGWSELMSLTWPHASLPKFFNVLWSPPTQNTDWVPVNFLFVINTYFLVIALAAG